MSTSEIKQMQQHLQQARIIQRRIVETERRYMTVREMGDILGLKKTERYWLVRKNKFKTEEILGQMRVEIDSFEKWYANQVKYKKVNGEEPGRELKLRSYSISDIAALLGVTDDRVYCILKEDEIEVEIVDYLKRVPRDAFWEWYAGQNRYRTATDAAKEGNIKGKSISMPEMAALLGITRSRVYEILKKDPKRDLLETVTLADRRRITKESFERWYGEQKKYKLLTGEEQENIAKETNARLKAHRHFRKSIKNKAQGDGNLNYLTREEAAILANVSKSTVTSWYTKGLISVKKYGSILRIPRTEYEQFLTKRELQRS